MPGWTVITPRTGDMAVHAVLIPGGARGRILYFGGYRVDDTHVFDVEPNYSNASITDIPANQSPEYNSFCSGHAFLADGRVLVAGGQLQLYDTNGQEIDPPPRDMPGAIEHAIHGGMSWGGERQCALYNPLDETWTEAAPLSRDPAGNPESGGRWYPTLTTLGNGQVLCVGGHPDLREEYPSAAAIRHSNNTPEIYRPGLFTPGQDHPGLGTWFLLASDPPDPEEVTAVDSDWGYDYQRCHLLSNGRVFFASPVRGRNRFYDPWARQFSDPINLPADEHYESISATWTSVMLPLLHNEGYRTRIMLMGGETAQMIDMGEADPAWDETTTPRDWSGTPPVRNFVCPVILPTGEIFFSGGCSENSDPDPDNPPSTDQIRQASGVRRAEIFDPQINWANGTYGTGEWRTVEEAEVPRHYHSVAILMPNGNIWTAGSNGPSEEGGGREQRIEVYEPEYADEDNRPTITSVTDNIGFGMAFEVNTPQANAIARVALIRCGSCTHGYNPDQRYVSVSFDVVNGSTLRVRAPSTGNIAPPGYYMLWIIDDQGRPCEWAPFIRLCSQKCFFTADISTYSIHEVDALGTPANFDSAMYLVFENFLPSEIGNPTLDLRGPGGVAVEGITLELGSAQYESNPNVADVAQRIAFPVRVTFDTAEAFDLIPNGEEFLNLTVNGEMGDFGCNTPFTLSLNPNPRMSDGNPHYLSIDLRVMRVHPGENPTASVAHGNGANAPYSYINDVVNAYNAAGAANHPFDGLPTSLGDNRLTLASEEPDGTPVFNYAVARVRFRAPEDVSASNVRVFFRQWTTGWSNLNYTDPSAAFGSYRRAETGGVVAPLLGIYGDEITNIPCFAEPRVADMTQQTDSLNLVPLIEGQGAQEVHTYFGCWLDINQDVGRFPLEPTSDGPFNGDLLSIQELMRGLHQCLVAEIHYDLDPTQLGATPASSDNLSQRNILLDDVDNPGSFASHIAHHTFEIKASPRAFPPPQLSASGAPAGSARLHPDELAIHWGGLPRDSLATLYFPQVDVDGVMQFAAQRGGPETLGRAGTGAISLDVNDVTYVPLPGPLEKDIASLLSIQLPPSIVKGQKFTIVVRQIDGRRRKVTGTTQFDIHVKTAPDIRPRLEHDFAVLRHIGLSIPESNRWYPVFGRYLSETEDRIRALGGNPDDIEPSPTGNPPRKPKDDDDKHRQVFVGRVAEIRYDCFGAFEGFILVDCDTKKVFRACEPGIEVIVRRACTDRAVLKIVTKGDPRHGHVCDIAVLCC